MKHFGDNPLRGATKHLCSKAHDGEPRTYARAVKAFGIEVLNCDAEKQQVNNNAFTQALDEGYRPLNSIPPYRRRRPSPRIQGQGRASAEEATSEPIPGDVYLARWPGLQGLVGVIVLPRDCFGDPSFEELGLEGSLADITFLMEDVPACYRICFETGHITGWAEGYDDREEKAGQREYPVMLLDSDRDLKSVAWLPRRGLRQYYRERQSNHQDLISNYDEIQEYVERRTRSRVSSRLQMGTAMGNEGGSGARMLQSSQTATVVPALPFTEILSTPSTTTTPTAAAPQPMGCIGRTIQASDTQQDLEVRSHAYEQGPSTPPNRALSNKSLATRPAVQDPQGNVVENTATFGCGVPRRIQAWGRTETAGNASTCSNATHMAYATPFASYAVSQKHIQRPTGIATRTGPIDTPQPKKSTIPRHVPTAVVLSSERGNQSTSRVDECHDMFLAGSTSRTPQD